MVYYIIALILAIGSVLVSESFETVILFATSGLFTIAGIIDNIRESIEKVTNMMGKARIIIFEPKDDDNINKK